MTEVIEQHRRTEDLRGRVRHVAPGDRGRAAVDSLEVRVVGPDVARTAHAKPTDCRGADVAEQIAEEVLHDEHVEPGRSHHKVVRRCV
jgi:hypothetical protein